MRFTGGPEAKQPLQERCFQKYEGFPSPGAARPRADEPVIVEDAPNWFGGRWPDKKGGTGVTPSSSARGRAAPDLENYADIKKPQRTIPPQPPIQPLRSLRPCYIPQNHVLVVVLVIVLRTRLDDDDEHDNSNDFQSNKVELG
jgi:hypothetical protein